MPEAGFTQMAMHVARHLGHSKSMLSVFQCAGAACPNANPGTMEYIRKHTTMSKHLFAVTSTL